MPHLDAISFFIVLILICPAVFAGLWNFSFAEKIRYGDGLRFVGVWMLFTVVVLVMNQIGREMLDPGRWPNERLFYGIEGTRLVGSGEFFKNLFFGWILFPLRVLPLAQYYIPAIITGAVAAVICLFGIEIIGRLFLAGHWKSRWSPALVAAFATLFFLSYASIGLVRQVAWIVTS